MFFWDMVQIKLINQLLSPC